MSSLRNFGTASCSSYRARFIGSDDDDLVTV
jgi:hypothetical protein